MLEISLLGEQRVAMDGSVVVALSAPRPMALIGFMLVHAGAPQRREHIAAQFWPDSTDAQARTNLRRELHALRAGFPHVDRWLTAEGGTLLWRLGPDCQLDVAAFEAAADAAAKAQAAGDGSGFRRAAAEAVRLYRGELMPALYDDWVMPERDRLHRSCLTLLDQLIDAGAGRRRLRPGHRAGPAEDRARAAGRGRVPHPASGAGAVRGPRGRAADLPPVRVGAGARAGRRAGPGDHSGVRAPHRRSSPAAGPRRRSRCPRSARWPPSARSGWSAARPSSPCCSSAGRKRSPGRPVSPWSRARPASGRPGCWTSCARRARRGRRHHAGPLLRGPGRLALAPVSEWLRSPALRSARGRLDPVWAREVDRLVPPPDAGPAGPAAARWTTPGSGTGSSRAWPGLCCRPGARRCWCSTTCSGATRTRWPGCSCCCTWAGSTRCWSWRRPGWRRPSGNAELSEMLRVLRSAGQVVDVTLTRWTPSGPRSWPPRWPGPRWASRGRAGCTPRPAATRCSSSNRCGRTSWTTSTGRAGIRGPKARAVLAGRIGQAGPPAREVAELAAVIGRDFTVELLTEASDLDPDVVVGAVDELWRAADHPRALGGQLRLLPRPAARHRVRRDQPAPAPRAAPPRGRGARAGPRR